MAFDKSTFDKVDHNTTVIINDVEYHGFGTGNANRGLLSSQLDHNLPFDPEILAVHLIVGYPSYSEYKDGATDLFKPSTVGGGYKYQRKYRFSNGAHFTSFHNITFDKATGLRGHFTTRDFPTDAFPGRWRIQDLVETFIPSGPGLVKSVMAANWKGDSKDVQAVIESEYYLNHNEQLPGLHWRHVTFETEHPSENVYCQSEKITVLKNLDFGRPQNLLGFKDTSVEAKLAAIKNPTLKQSMDLNYDAAPRNEHSNGNLDWVANSVTNGANGANGYANGAH
ncbi:MAG: hypothetical protein M1837_002697 [Sclerophora amabilis]|nr:MAG: hypothetical protein M1837_002697 [Sclerophora amabilis]